MAHPLNSDYFALLGEPRRPWLDPEAVQAKFIKLSAALHPDRLHNASVEVKAQANERFAELNAAASCLRDPKQRLLHLLELERGAKLSHLERIASSEPDFYFEAGFLCRQVDGFIAEKRKAASPLVKAQLFEKGLDWTEKLRELQAALGARRQSLEAELKQLDLAWQKAAPAGSPERLEQLPLHRLEQIYRELSYGMRWFEQVRERLVALIL